MSALVDGHRDPRTASVLICPVYPDGTTTARRGVEPPGWMVMNVSLVYRDVFLGYALHVEVVLERPDATEVVWEEGEQ